MLITARTTCVQTVVMNGIVTHESYVRALFFFRINLLPLTDNPSLGLFPARFYWTPNPAADSFDHWVQYRSRLSISSSTWLVTSDEVWSYDSRRGVYVPELHNNSVGGSGGGFFSREIGPPRLPFGRSEWTSLFTTYGSKNTTKNSNRTKKTKSKRYNGNAMSILRPDHANKSTQQSTWRSEILTYTSHLKRGECFENQNRWMCR